MTSPFLNPIALTGRFVSLDPLSISHAEPLLEAAQSDEIWRHTVDRPQSPQLMRDYIASALAARDNHTAIPFAVRRLTTGRWIGCTRYANIAPARRGLEIGYTWYAPEAWGKAVNIECKYLLLKHAFESLQYIRLEFQAMVENARSRAAILRLGAKEEGILRARFVRANGQRFDSVFYSILDAEWPAVKARLEAMLKIAAVAEAK